MIFSRILYPASKKETYENRNNYFENFNFSEDDMYRSLNYFKDYKEELELLLWNNTKEKYKRDTTQTYYDCTNYYFEIEYNDEDIFIHYSAIEMDGYKTLSEGTLVKYELHRTDKGLQAKNVFQITV